MKKNFQIYCSTVKIYENIIDNENVSWINPKKCPNLLLHCKNM